MPAHFAKVNIIELNIIEQYRTVNCWRLLCFVVLPFLETYCITLCFVAGLYRLKGPYDATSDLEEMRREKEEADKEPRISILSLVSLSKIGLIYILTVSLIFLFVCFTLKLNS